MSGNDTILLIELVALFALLCMSMVILQLFKLQKSLHLTRKTMEARERSLVDEVNENFCRLSREQERLQASGTEVRRVLGFLTNSIRAKLKLYVDPMQGGAFIHMKRAADWSRCAPFTDHSCGIVPL